MSTKIFIV